jgi:hypothetical protein
MGTQTVSTVFDDLDGTTEQVGTYRFALEDITYEIDLSPGNLGQLHAALSPFIAAGRRLPKTTKARNVGKNKAGTTNADLRAWWVSQNRTDLPPYRANGPIPAAVHAAYRAANS